MGTVSSTGNGRARRRRRVRSTLGLSITSGGSGERQDTAAHKRNISATIPRTQDTNIQGKRRKGPLFFTPKTKKQQGSSHTRTEYRSGKRTECRKSFFGLHERGRRHPRNVIRKTIFTDNFSLLRSSLFCR